MVFEPEARFQQFIHSKFRENTVRVLYVPTAERDKAVLVVNKFGKVGLYDVEKLSLIHTYMVDLCVPMVPKSSIQSLHRSYSCGPPKCQRTHLVQDAVYCPELKFIIFVTSKNVIQCYDVGEIESLAFGLEVFPREKFLKLKKGLSPAVCRNMGHVETHRLFGPVGDGSSPPPSFTCIEYMGPSTKQKRGLSTLNDTSADGENQSQDGRPPFAPGGINISTTPAAPPPTTHRGEPNKDGVKLILGDTQGNITIITIPTPTKPFGRSKERGKLHQITFGQLESRGYLQVYKAHTEAVKQIRYIFPRNLVISASRDKKFSLYIKDLRGTTDPYIISLPKGVNTFAYSAALKIIATGGEDGVVRLFNQFVAKMPQMELLGHKCPIMALEFLHVHFSETPLLVSYSSDVELRAWNPVDYTCLQSVYVVHPPAAALRNTAPEFGKSPLVIYQPRYEPRDDNNGAGINNNNSNNASKSSTNSSNGYIIVLYCNFYAKLDLEIDMSHWPFDFDDFMAEFEEMTHVYQKKIISRHKALKESRYGSRDPNTLRLTPEEISAIETKLDGYVHDILKIKRDADKQLRTAIYEPGKKSLAGEGTRKFLNIRANTQVNDICKRDGVSTAFKTIPLFPMPPIEFSQQAQEKGLPLSSLMKKAGISSIKSVQDLLQVQNCFSQENLGQIEFEAHVTAKLAEYEKNQP